MIRHAGYRSLNVCGSARNILHLTIWHRAFNGDRHVDELDYKARAWTSFDTAIKRFVVEQSPTHQVNQTQAQRKPHASALRKQVQAFLKPTKNVGALFWRNPGSCQGRDTQRKLEK